MIALSIAFLAVEIAKGGHGFSARKPWMVALAFGLLHGFGFANALAELQLAKPDIPLALLFFNLGVELGQLAFVALLIVLQTGLRTLDHLTRERASRVGYYGLGTLAMYWFFERIQMFV